MSTRRRSTQHDWVALFLTTLAAPVLIACGGPSSGATSNAGFSSVRELVSAFDTAYQEQSIEAAKRLFCRSDGTDIMFETLWSDVVGEHVMPGDGLVPEQREASAIEGIEYELGEETSVGVQVEFVLDIAAGNQRLAAQARQQDDDTWLFCG